MKFYGPTCVEDADRAELEAYMSSGVSPEQQQRVLEQVQLQSMQPGVGPWHKAGPLERRPPKPPPRWSPNIKFEMGEHGVTVATLPGECKNHVCVYRDAVVVPKLRQRMPQVNVSKAQS